MPKNKLVRTTSNLTLHHPDLPTVPEAFRRTDYEGWLEEAIKRIQLKRYQRTQAERIAVLEQINELQGQCLALRRNEANWRHFQQEDRLRKKRLDIEELELDQRMEDFLYARQNKLFARANGTAEYPKHRDPVAEITAQVENAIRTEVGLRDVFSQARKRYPHLEDWLREWGLAFRGT
jgi:hypothetical protein